MIVDFIISAMVGFVKLVLGVLPDVPAMPTAITSAGDWVVSTINGVIGIFNMVYGSTLMAALTIVIVGMFTYEWVYHSVMWIVRKIPMINIK